VSGVKSNSDQRILIDARPLQGPSARRGIGRYVRGLLEGFFTAGHRGQMGLLIDAAMPVPPVPPGDFVMFAVSRRYRGRLAGYEDSVRLASDLARIGPSLYHATTLSLPAPSPIPLVVTVHDLIPWAVGGWGNLGERLRYSPGRRRLRGAERILAVSQATASDVVRLAGVDPDRVDVIPEAVGEGFAPRPGAQERVRARFGLGSPYLLYVGALDRRKDPAALLRALAVGRQAVPDLDLVLAGDPGPQAPRDLGAARRLGYVDDSELTDLYCAATALLFPSRYEGFGLPVLEAMACGCPVVCYANSSLSELVGDAGVLVPDGDGELLGRRALEVAQDGDLARRLSQAGLERSREYSWTRAARGTLEAYRRVLQGSRP